MARIVNKRRIKEQPPPHEMPEQTVRQIVKLLSPDNIDIKRLMGGCVRGEYMQARAQLLTPPAQGRQAANKKDGRRLEQLVAQIQKIFDRTPAEAFAVTDSASIWDTPEDRRGIAGTGLLVLGATAKDLQTTSIGDHGARDRCGPIAAKAAYRLMINLPIKRRPTSGSRNSVFRQVAGLFCATLKGLPTEGDNAKIPDLERACEAVLDDVKRRGDAAYRWQRSLRD
jgi:hypothetical protein